MEKEKKDKEKILRKNLIKKKEDIVRLEQFQLEHMLDSSKEETWKTNIMFVVAGILLQIVVNLMEYGIDVRFSVVAIFIAFVVGVYNFISKKVESHYTMNKKFADDKIDYESFLEKKLKQILISYKNVKESLDIKIQLNKYSFLLLALALLLLLI
ncbi:MAG: hypothetical protein ACPGTS_00050 [Minisyncoccia bacterium]